MNLKNLLGAILLFCSIAFIAQADDDEPLNCDDPMTQGAINQCNTIKKNAAEENLQKDYALALSSSSDENFDEDDEGITARAALEKSQDAWREYSFYTCKALSRDFGGSMESGIYYKCMQRLNERRSEELKAFSGPPFADNVLN